MKTNSSLLPGFPKRKKSRNSEIARYLALTVDEKRIKGEELAELDVEVIEVLKVDGLASKMNGMEKKISEDWR